MDDYDDLVGNDLNEEYVQLKMAFPKLKQVCDPIAKDPYNRRNAGNLRETLKTIRTPILQKYSEYLFCPIFIRLSDDTLRSDGVCAVMECLKVLLEYVPIEDEKQFHVIFSLSFKKICSDSDDGLVTNISEELKLAVVGCLSKLFSNATSEVLKSVYIRSSLQRFTAVIYHLVVMAKREKFIQLRVEALQCLQCILQIRGESHASWRRQVATLMMVALPGIVSCAVGVATSTGTLNHKIVVEAIRLWGGIVGLIMDDTHSQSVLTRTFQLYPGDLGDPGPYGRSEPRSESADTKMTDEWLTASGRKLVPSTEKILTLQQHDHVSVRLELVTQVSHVLSTAAKNMHLSVKYLVDTLICLGQDSDPKVAKAGKKALDEFSRTCELGSSSKKLVEIVEESFYSLVTRLPRILHGFDLSLKEKHLLLLCGYTDVLGERYLPGLLNSVSHLNRLLKSLYIAATLDCSIVTLLEEQAVRDFDEDVIGNQKVWKVLKHSNSPRYLKTLHEIGSKLMKYSDGSIVHAILDDFQNHTVYRKEITLLLIIIFGSSNSTTLDHELTDQVLRTVMDLKLWDLPVEIHNADEKPLAQSNVVQICLLAELVAALAAAQGADAFVSNLLTCLYPLLECAGSPLYAISSAGFSSIGSLAALYGGDVGHLVANNVDYLSYRVTLNLRHAHRNPRVLSVLSVIMNHSTFQVFPSLYAIVKDVLVQSCDTFQDVNASAFLQVFLTFISRISDWENCEAAPPERSPEHTHTPSAWEEIYDYYKASRAARDYADEPMPESEHENMSHSMETNEETEEPIPDHIKLTIEMLNRSLHFLPSKEIPRQIQVLQILEKGVVVLSSRTNQLLPMVHKIWSPLVRRFSPDADPLVIHRSFVVLCTLARTSKEFIRNRTSKEVIPFLCKYLKQQSSITQRERDRPSHRMSQSYKLVRVLLCGLGEISVCLDLGEDELENVVSAAVCYLSSAQPLPLQEAACRTIKTISTKDSNIVWVQLVALLGSDFEATSNKLHSFKVDSTAPEDDTYRENSLKLLNEIG